MYLLVRPNVVWDDRWRQILRHDGLSNLPMQKGVIRKICEEIENETYMHYFHPFTFPWSTSSKHELRKKYQEFGVDVLLDESIDWKQVEGKLRQFLSEYFCNKYDVVWDDRWRQILRHDGLSNLPVQKGVIREICEEIENEIKIEYYHLSEFPSNTLSKNNLRKKYQEFGVDVLLDESIDWKQVEGKLRHFALEYFDEKYDDEACIRRYKTLGYDGLETELGFQGITVEDLGGKQHIIYNKFFTNDVDYLINQVARKTGISKDDFVLVYRENLIVPGKHLYIPDGAKLQLLPLEKDQKPPTNFTTFVRGTFKELYGMLDRLFSFFPNVFKDTTRLLSEKDFVRICQLIGKGWGMLGIELGLTKVKLQQIKEDKQNVVSRIFEMLSQWSQTRKDGATAGQLLSAVMKSGVSCDFDELKRVLLVGL